MARQLPAGCAVLEDSCPPHLSDAAQIMNDAWNSITANTIAACWKHTPCLDVNEERDSVDFVARIEQDSVVQMNKLKTVSPRQNIPTHQDQAKLSHASLQADSWAQLNDTVASNSVAIEHINNRFLGLESALHSVDELQHAVEERLEAMDLRVSAKALSGGDAVQRLDTLQSKVTELDHGLDRCLSSCLDQELRLQLLERATYDGVLLWKIDDFARRKKEAVDGVTMSLYSIPFYTSRHGYKMCARVYLNGDGMGKGTHLSFFFVVMKGPFDALLPWPFKQKVTLIIINQAGKKHVTDTFRPDPQSNSFQRPTQKEMNVASGCPMFIRQDQLLNGGFVKDDCIFLRVVVDVTDIGTLVL
ncbi:hypothetical protein EMCRGX_G016576 [Ephydatia muelleri]